MCASWAKPGTSSRSSTRSELGLSSYVSMSASGRLAAETLIARPPSMLYVASVAALSPMGLNAAVGLAPVLDGAPLDGASRAATVALFTLGLGLGQPLFGDLADRWGRRPSLLAGLALASVGAILAAAASDWLVLLIGRLATGLGLSTCLVVPRALMRDLHQGAELQRNMAVLASVFALMPAITPPIAWLLGATFSWRAPMALVAVLVLLLAAVAWRTHRETRPSATLVPGRAAWTALARNRGVQRATLAFTGAAAPFFVVAAAGPQALRDSTGASEGLVAVVLGATYLGFGAGSYWVRRLARLPGAFHMSCGLGLVGVGCALLLATLAWPALWLWGLALALHAVGHGIVFPATFALVLQHEPRQSGLATAAVGTVHMSGGALAATAAGMLPLSTHLSVVVMAAAMVAVGCAAWFLLPPEGSLMNSWIDRAMLALHALGAAVLAAMVAVICYDVLGRLLFNRPFAGTAELTGAGLVLVTFLQAPHVIREGKLLRVTFLVERVPTVLRSALGVLAWSVGAAVFTVFALAGWEPALSGWARGEFYGNDAFRLPASPLRFATLILWILGAAVCIGLAVKAVPGRGTTKSSPPHA
ncbi:MFS transporter [Ramlibacter sp. AN1015]|uniref:MFS transporter n=1 Tax=Ramlibacter sp. AN1015 TaxID=3133428 RepID=UPI0030BC3BD9